MAQNAAAAVEVPDTQGLAGDEQRPSPVHARRGIGRRHSNWVTELHIKLDATDARALARLRDAYGRDGSTLIRDLIREKYADLFEEGPPPVAAEADPYGPEVALRGRR
jgi:hypothetical protein